MLTEDTETFDAYTTTANMTQTIPNETSKTILSTKMPSDVETVLSDEEQLQSAIDLRGVNTAVLEDKYSIEEEIHGGGMSRIFRARHRKLGNEWIVKWIYHAKLENEEHILKQLNHINLPQIIDIFRDSQGIFLVERYIDGFPLQVVLSSAGQIGQTMVLDWAEQLGQVLHYLHNQDMPIIHCDLKPSNIMVTHDNKLVLIDFGISKQQGITDDSASGVTYKYAAPEQLQHAVSGKYHELVLARFGEFPKLSADAKIDVRTDIYSLGVILFEIAVGNIPLANNMDLLKDKVSSDLAKVIYKCLEVDPEKRYASIKDFQEDIRKIKNTKVSMAKTLFVRKVVVALLAVTVLLSTSSTVTAAYIYNQENLSHIALDANSIILSEQQASELIIQKQKPNGEIEIINADKIKWSYSGGEIARVESNKIIGINEGSTEVYGKYRNKLITLKVQVVKPLNGIVEISLKYVKDVQVETLAGTGNRELTDGAYVTSSFVSPESIEMLSDGSLIVTDAGKIRKLQDGRTSTIHFEPDYITADIIRSYGNDMYVLTDEWQDEDGIYYGMIKLSDDLAEPFYFTEAIYTKIVDFDISKDGLIYFIQHNVGVGETYLNTLNPDTGEISFIQKLDNDATALTLDEQGNVYIAYAQKGVIVYFDTDTKQLTYFAGVENERHFIDGNVARFYEPQKLKVVGNQLYVLDFNVLRRITILDGIAVYTETIAGEVTTDLSPAIKNGSGAEALFTPSTQMDFIVDGDKIVLTDPKNSRLRKITLD